MNTGLPSVLARDQPHGYGPPAGVNPHENGPFDLFEWHPAYQSCQKFFLDHAQYDSSVQAVASLINIALPHQWLQTPIRSSMPVDSSPPPLGDDESVGQGAEPSNPVSTFATSRPQNLPAPPPYLTVSPSRQPWVSLVPFVRRLVVTGFDREPVLHGFFGDDWRNGIGPLQECERRNYLFAARSKSWTRVKAQYDMGPSETVPFLQPPQNIQLAEIENAETLWNQWLAMEDWMIGPQAPTSMND